MSPLSSIRGWLIVVVYLTAAACANGSGSQDAATGVSTDPSTVATSRPLVVFLGDSLTAGHDLPVDQAYPALVAAGMERLGTPIRVVNAGVSGDTTTGGLERLAWLLAQQPDLLVVALGYNDAFRGQPVETISANLRAIVAKARTAGVRVLILGMRVPPNFGPDYSARFARIYTDVAEEAHVARMPFLLAGVGGRPELNFDDGIHPNAEGQRIIAGNVLPYVDRTLKGK